MKCSGGKRFAVMVFDDPGSIKVTAKEADLQLCPGPFNLFVAGAGVRLRGSTSVTPGKAAKNSCEGKFIPFPEH